MISAEQIITTNINEYLAKYRNLGGVIDFNIFKVIGTTSDIDSHLLTAKSTLELLHKDYDNEIEKIISVDAGKSITLDEFFGPYFNVKTQRPILRGTTWIQSQNYTALTSNYYYYDDIESDNNIISLKTNNNSDYSTKGYADAFLEPPHSFGSNPRTNAKMSNIDIGKFFLEYNAFLFDDINSIIVYSWQTDCSSYFDDGKEWWGSFFWTVYNPTKNWYIGIVASTTD
jgi:hypothetical protein